MIILLDIDGVLADFVSSSLKLFNREDLEIDRWDFYEQLGISSQDFWSHIDKQGFQFWRDVPKTHFADKFIWTLRKHGLLENTILCSSPSLSSSSAKGKLEWIQKNYSDFSRRYMLTPNKFLLQGNFSLIDNSDENCEKFHRNNPFAEYFKVPQPWNSAKMFIGTRVQRFEMFVQKLKTKEFGG